MLEGFISSRTRVNILVKLFLNAGTRAYLRELAGEFGVSTNAVRTELNHLTKHKILTSEQDGRSVYYRANLQHPLFPELSSMVRKITGIDDLVHSVVDRLGTVEGAYLVGDYAKGRDSGVIDVILIGDVDKVQLDDFVGKTEEYIGRKIRSLVVSRAEFESLLERGVFQPAMKLWEGEAETTAGPSTV